MFKKRMRHPPTTLMGLGLTSIAIGITELTAPKLVQDLLGIDDNKFHRGILQVLGVRELMHGIGILTAKPGGGRESVDIWARVAGDVLDCAFLGVAAAKTRRAVRFCSVAGAVTAIGGADLYYATKTAAYDHSRQK
jgi:hypothetical protein